MIRSIVERLQDRAQKEIDRRVEKASQIPTTSKKVSAKKGAHEGVYFIASSAAAWIVMQIPTLRPAEESIIEVISIAIGALIASGLKAVRNYLKHKYGVKL